MQSIFHLAFNVTDLETACEFYTNTLGCKQGRRTETWVDYNFFGHQLSLHIGEPFHVKPTGKVDKIAVPMPHFGAILPIAQWKELATKLHALDTNFIIQPSVRFEGQAGEQHTMFFSDPFGNPIELKSFANTEQVFQA
ncbi:VOC family protein [Marinomonas sp. 2405UD68-3]|uniref:VOC family protein n=1 Tax=Marinomonas sp. 2405UD68-3 TaxID=3391835 RepID=UPI0039C93798